MCPISGEPGPDLAVLIEVPQDPGDAFDAFHEGLTSSLAGLGLQLDPLPNGRVTEAGRDVGRIAAWESGKAIRLD